MQRRFEEEHRKFISNMKDWLLLVVTFWLVFVLFVVGVEYPQSGIGRLVRFLAGGDPYG